MIGIIFLLCATIFTMSCASEDKVSFWAGKSQVLTLQRPLGIERTLKKRNYIDIEVVVGRAFQSESYRQLTKEVGSLLEATIQRNTVNMRLLEEVAVQYGEGLQHLRPFITKNRKSIDTKIPRTQNLPIESYFDLDECQDYARHLFLVIRNLLERNPHFLGNYLVCGLKTIKVGPQTIHPNQTRLRRSMSCS